MADYIDREAVVNVICEMHAGGQDAVKNALPNTYGADLREIIEEIDSLPSADVQSVRHGRWLDGNRNQPCSVCKYRGKKSWNYCPNCGARMDGE